MSIVIPVYNGSNFLHFAIDSALNQTYSNIEVVVVDDGSTDQGATRAIVEGYGSRVRYLWKENGGSSSALNSGIAAMKGEYFSWLSHDDVYHPEKIERQIDCLRSANENVIHSDTDMRIVVTASEIIGRDGTVIRRPTSRSIDRTSTRIGKLSEVQLVVAIISDMTFHGCAYLLPRSCFARLGGFDESLRLVNDADFWFRLFSHGYELLFVPEVLVQGRFHRDQLSQSSRSTGLDDPERIRLLNEVIDWVSSSDDPDKARILFRFAGRLNSRGLFSPASLAYQRSAEMSRMMALSLPLALNTTRILGLLRLKLMRLYVRFAI